MDKDVKQLEEELNKMTNELSLAYEELSLLYEISSRLGTILDVEKLPVEIINKAINILDVRCGYLLLFDEMNSKLTVRAARGFPPEILELFKTKYDPDKGIAGKCVRKKQPLVHHFKDKIKDANISEVILGITHLMCVPMIYKDISIGVIALGDKLSGEPFRTPDVKLVFALAVQTSGMMQNAKLYSQLQDLFMAAITSLSSAIDEKDIYTFGHSNRVTNYAMEIGRMMNLNKEDMAILELAAILHDVGKIGIPDAILRKPDKLTEEEWHEIKKHPEKGVHIVEPMGTPEKARAAFKNYIFDPKKDILPLILGIKHHHERFDGYGYPEGLDNSSIPLISRIIAVADAFDAMTSKRSYRNALPVDKALEELKKNAGAQHDPEIVDIFIKIIKERMRKNHSCASELINKCED
jgi:putative nucleotidyltransferase with HDIG domain